MKSCQQRRYTNHCEVIFGPRTCENKLGKSHCIPGRPHGAYRYCVSWFRESNRTESGFETDNIVPSALALNFNVEINTRTQRSDARCSTFSCSTENRQYSQRSPNKMSQIPSNEIQQRPRFRDDTKNSPQTLLITEQWFWLIIDYRSWRWNHSLTILLWTIPRLIIFLRNVNQMKDKNSLG